VSLLRYASAALVRHWYDVEETLELYMGVGCEESGTFCVSLQVKQVKRRSGSRGLLEAMV
jgi:hypothetical protein